MQTTLPMDVEKTARTASAPNPTVPEEVVTRRYSRRTFLAGLGAGIGLSIFLSVLAQDLYTFIEGQSLPELGGLAPAQPAPNFTATNLQGKPVQLRDYLGRPLMLTFWTPKCPECVGEIPYLQAIADDPTLDVDLLTVAIDTPADLVSTFLQEQQFTIPTLVDEANTVADLYQLKVVPFTFLINPDGSIGEALSPERAFPHQLKGEVQRWLSACGAQTGCSVGT